MAATVQIADRESSALSSQLAAAGLFLLTLISVALRPREIREADVFWHLATGRWILEHRHIPALDPFSHTAASVPWTNHEWLFQVLLRLGQAAGGMTLLYGAKVLLYSAAHGVACRTPWRRLQNPAAVVAASALALFAALPFSEYRPLMLSLLFFALAMEGGRRISDGRRDPWFWLPVLFAGWANCHAMFLLGLAAIALCSMPPTGWRKGPKEAKGWSRSWMRWGSLVTLCVAATLINRYGFHVWAVPFKVVGSRLFMAANEEWRPPDTSMEFSPFFVSLPVLVLGLCRRTSPLPLGEKLLAVLFALLCFRSRRLIPMYSLAAVPVLAVGFSVMEAAFARRFGSARMRIGVPIVLALLLGTGTLWGFRLLEPSGLLIVTSDGLVFPSGAFPRECAAALAESPAGGNAFNDYNHGGFLHYTVGPRWKVFIDGRNDLYGEKLTLLYQGIALEQIDRRAAFEKLKIDAALVSYAICANRPNVAMNLAEDPAWALVEFDEAGMLYVRRSRENQAWIAGREYRAVKPMYLAEEQIPVHREQKTLPLFIKELQRRTAQSPCRIADQMLAEAMKNR